MKKIIALAAVLIMYGSVSEAAAPIYTSVREEIVTGGVTLKNEQRFFGDYALNINCVTADLKNDNLKLDLLKSRYGCDKVATVKAFAEANPETVVAINGDFFSPYSGNQNFSLGIEVKDGELLQSHINTDMAAGFMKDNILSFSYISFEGEVEAPDGTKMPIAHINKPTDYYGAVLMYTSDFNGGTSPFFPAGITVITVENDTVTGKGVSLGGTVSVPEDGYILVIDDNMTPFLEYKFNIEDKVGLKIDFSPSIEDVQTAFGGGTLLLEDGKKTKITHNVSGNNPRTAIGTNSDGTVVYFITVDGRQTVSRGVSLDAFADICLEMGCVNALNLDGGGSTAMVGRTFANGQLHEINEPSENRKVINALAITGSAERGKAAGIFIEAENDCVLSGDSVKLILTPYDENYNVPTQTKGKIKLELSGGKGTIRDNVFYAQGSGTAVIEAFYNGKKTDSVSIRVINDVAGIIAPREITLNKGESYPGAGKIKVFDKNGRTAVVRDLTLLRPKFDTKLVALSLDGTVKAVGEGASEITLVHGYAQRSIEVICGDYEIDSQKARVADPMEKQSTAGYRFDIYASSDINTLFDRAVYAHSMKVLSEADSAAIIGGDKPSDITPSDLSPIIADTFSEKTVFGGKVITLKQSSGKLARGEQWKKFVAAVEGASQDNIFIIADEEPGFVSDLDRQAFHALLSGVAERKNVFVIYSGSENFCRIANGVRFITVADPRDEDNIHDSVKNARYLSFRISDNAINYSFEKIFN